MDSGINWSDHWSFWKEGYPALMLTDTALPLSRVPHYRDLPDRINGPDFARAACGSSMRSAFGRGDGGAGVKKLGAPAGLSGSSDRPSHDPVNHIETGGRSLCPASAQAFQGRVEPLFRYRAGWPPMRVFRVSSSRAPRERAPGRLVAWPLLQALRANAWRFRPGAA
jgi:hypothetical protein